MKTIKIWTDGACTPNPGNGGWAYALSKEYYDFGFEEQTTNNRMEMTAISEALKYAKSTFPEHKIVVISDSKYCVNGFNIWMLNWQKKNWSKKGGIKNLDLWKQLFEFRENVTLEWVKGHNGNEMNEFVDVLASGLSAPETVEKTLFETAMHYQGLFYFFSQEYGLTLLHGEMDDIIQAVNDHENQTQNPSVHFNLTLK